MPPITLPLAAPSTTPLKGLLELSREELLAWLAEHGEKRIACPPTAAMATASGRGVVRSDDRLAATRYANP